MTNHPNRNWRRRAIDRAVSAFRAARDRLPPGGALEVALVVYPDDRTFLRHRLADWPQLSGAAAHREFITGAVQPALEAEGASVRLVELEPASSMRWREANAVTEDTDTIRAAWAAEQ